MDLLTDMELDDLECLITLLVSLRDDRKSVANQLAVYDSRTDEYLPVQKLVTSDERENDVLDNSNIYFVI